ncbi:MAG: hypothetical protein IKD76_06165 [Clostridia bacterium]|nr:hypothetical protein [Clostridia bacterium]
MKKLFPQILKEYGIEYEYDSQGHKITPIEPEKKQNDTKEVFFESIIDSTINGGGRVMSDATRAYGMIAKLKAKNSRTKESEVVERKTEISKSSSNDELERA